MVLIPLFLFHSGLVFFTSLLPSWLLDVSQIIGWYALAITIWLLLVYTMKSQGRIATSLFSIIIVAAVCFLGILSYFSLSFPEESLYLLVMFISGIFITLIGMITTRFFIRKRNTFKNFILRHPVWHLLISLMIGLLIYFMFSLMGVPTGWAGGVLLEGLTFGVMMGIVLYLVLFPFLFLAFFNRIYRSRLESVFGLEKVESRSGSLSGEQKEKNQLKE